MINKIKEQIELLFEEAPQTKKAFELKEEIIANAVERYQDLVAEGFRESDAYKNVINSIGNVSELFASFEADPAEDPHIYQKQRQKSALIATFSVGLYIFAAMVVLASYTVFPLGEVGLLIALAICIIPTCLLVYSAIAYPNYHKKEDTVVEDFKKWNAESKKIKSLRVAISTVLWILALFLYLVVSFVTWDWYITWLMFIAAGCIEAIVHLIFKIKEMRDSS